MQSNKENRDGYSYEPGYIYVIWRNDNRKSDGNQRRADNVTGLLSGSEFYEYLRSQKDTISAGFLMHIGIDDFWRINSSCGSDYGDYILKNVADCMKECISDRQRLYHLVEDQYLIADLQDHNMEDAAALRKKSAEK